MADAEEEDEGQVEASLEELIAKKADRPTITDDEDEDESLLATGRDERASRSPPRCCRCSRMSSCARAVSSSSTSQLADRRRTLCRDCA